MNSQYDPEMYVGIDVSKAQLDVAIGQEGETWQAANTAGGIGSTVKRLEAYRPLLVVVESTGGLEKPLVKALQESGIPVALVHPGRVRKFAAGIGWLAKTDRLDARLLAWFAFSAHPHPKPQPNPACEDLSELVRRRNQIIEMLTAERNRRATCPSSMLEALEEHITWLTTERDRLTTQIETMLSTQPEFHDKDVILQSAKGVGPILSATLQAELPELGRYSHKQIAALVGVAPFSKDSGRYHGKRQIKGGRSGVRCTLYLGTLSAIRYNPVIRAHYQQLVERGKLRKVAIVACMRKLLVILNAMIRDLRPWQPPSAPVALDI
ncbi:MAG: IS110 family transposase [Anaerolineaceae bacterium]|nr:IS110 family transposase [Anaerolineaceae bacterium]